MVNSSEQLDRVFGALADPTRRGMLALLATRERTVGELAEPFDMSLPAISKHLKVLEHSGLVHRTVEGRVHRCRMEAEPLVSASEWIDRHREFWDEQLDRLADYLEQQAPRRRRRKKKGKKR